jgi:hypothetical protein
VGLKPLALTSCAALVVAGCSIEPGTVVSEQGPVSSAPSSELSSFGVFRSRYEQLLSDQTSSEKAFAVVEAGTQLEYQLCSSFFTSAGRQQQILLFSKDLVTFVATAAAGALGAAHASPAAIAWIGLGGAGAITAANIYARNYLFSEDNVEAVQDLTLRAVGAARDASLSNDRRNAYTFSSAISTIMDVQSVCEVQHIINLSRDAIKNGAIAVSTNDNLNSTITLAAKVDLGRVVKGGIPLTDTELTALYWLYGSNQSPTSSDEKKRAAAALSNLTPAPLLASGDPNPAFKQSGQVTGILAGLPASLADQLRAAIQENLRVTQGGPNPAGVPLRLRAAPAAAFLAPLPSGGESPGRISVRIQQLP